jgi:hypothetical protein
MTTKRINRLLILTIILFGQCTNNYKRGEREFNLEKYDEAKSYYKLVEQGDTDYGNAQSKILAIDSIIDKQIFDRAISLYNENMFADAQTFLLKIDSTSYLFNNSTLFLNKIDSIRLAIQLENKRQEKERKLGEEKAINDVKQKIKVLYNDLVSFKDKSDFHYYGFRVGYKYNKWLTEVQELKNAPEAKLLLQHGFVVGDLEMLGLEYLNSKGKETEYSIWAKKTISDGLKM